MHLPDPASAQRWCAEQRQAGRTLGFAPTMGALHEGHAAMLRQAQAENDLCCVSIFVNPLQFNDAADLQSYPRDFDRDANLLKQAGAAMVFTGALAQFFPECPDTDDIPMRDPGPGAQGLEGDSRPGHFDGVATIVERLFRVVGPGRAYFGEKDFQQTLVVRDLADQLGYPEIVVVPTVREPSGLALSSRNFLLSPAQRDQASCLSRALFAARNAWRRGQRDPSMLRQTMLDILQASGADVEYAEVRDPLYWRPEPPQGIIERAQGLAAAVVGPVRLIDTLRLDYDSPPAGWG